MLRLLEHYTSTQGEGPNVGILTQFIRFAGCNLKCPGWPCDTPYSIDPKIYRKEQRLISPRELYQLIKEEYVKTGTRNLCFTGGEPLLQPRGELEILLNQLVSGFKCEVFTNGTQPISENLAELAYIVVDWKLPGSGEDSLNPTRIENLDIISDEDSIKFVIKEQQDLVAAHELWTTYLEEHGAQVFVGPAWNTMAASHIVEYVKKHRLPWRLNIQVHNYVYGAQVRGI